MRIMSLVILAFAMGCGQDGSSSLTLLLTDAPGDFQKVPVIIDAVHARFEGEHVAEPAQYQNGDGTATQQQSGSQGQHGQWLQVLNQQQQHDLLQLQNGKTARLGEQQLPSGYYNRLRLTLKQAQVEVDGKVHSLKVPAEGIELAFQFQLKKAEGYELTLDFDAGKSIQKNADGSYAFKPDVTVKQFQWRHQNQDPAQCQGEECKQAGAEPANSPGDPARGDPNTEPCAGDACKK